MKRFDCDNPLEVAKVAIWLAWTASEILGMGLLKRKDDATPEELWALATGQAIHDYPVPRGSEQEIVCDYVYGRMMKLTLRIGDGFIEYPDAEPVADYQSWSDIFSTYEELLTIAREFITLSTKSDHDDIAEMLKTNNKLLFHPGNVLITPAAFKLLEDGKVSMKSLLERHLTLDKGELCDSDHQMNYDALNQGERILNRYKIDNTDESVYVITEYDRSVTTVLLPCEY